MTRRYQGRADLQSVSPIMPVTLQRDASRSATIMRNECVMIGCFNSGINTADFPIPIEAEKSARWCETALLQQRAGTIV